MITPQYVSQMAEYNGWMNVSLYRSARRLDDERIIEDRGAYFKSLHGTLAHLVWADQLWLDRLNGLQTSSPDVFKSRFDALAQARSALDQAIAEWAGTVTLHWLEQPFSWYSGTYKRTFTQPGWLVVTHFFNHQTHHRGQATNLLMQAGIDPGVTDLVFMAEQQQI